MCLAALAFDDSDGAEAGDAFAEAGLLDDADHVVDVLVGVGLFLG